MLVTNVAKPALPLPLARPAAARPSAAKPASPDTLSISRNAVMAKLGIVRLAPGKDALAVTIVPGDTLWKLASRWGAPGSTAAYVETIKQANGLKDDRILAGQKLLLPYNEDQAGLALLVGIAIKKDMAARGPLAPVLELKGVQVNPGPLDSYLVTVPRADGTGPQHFAVFDDQTGEDPLKWSIQPLTPEEYEKRQNGEL